MARTITLATAWIMNSRCMWVAMPQSAEGGCGERCMLVAQRRAGRHRGAHRVEEEVPQLGRQAGLAPDAHALGGVGVVEAQRPRGALQGALVQAAATREGGAVRSLAPTQRCVLGLRSSVWDVSAAAGSGVRYSGLPRPSLTCTESRRCPLLASCTCTAERCLRVAAAPLLVVLPARDYVHTAEGLTSDSYSSTWVASGCSCQHHWV
jgi:hypothetical protein